MPARPSPTAVRCTAGRSGFSLVELLVVLGIIAAMTGMVLGGVFRSRDGNRLLAAEQVLADAIRQARHTARSTGAPVELRLTPSLDDGGQVVGAKIAGVTRTPLWSETFDKVRDLNDNGVIDPAEADAYQLPATGTNGLVVGRSGNGRLASTDHPVVHELTRDSRLVRGGQTEGFFLACSVLPTSNVSLGAIVPLVMVAGDDGKISGAQCALWLWGVSLPIQDNASVVVWEARGSVWDGNGNEKVVSSLGMPPTTRLGPDPLPSGSPDPGNLITGGRWVDLGLLYDGERLVLYLDGRRVGELRSGVQPAIRRTGDHVHVGMLHFDADADPVFAPMPLDDVRLYRLGTAEVAELPGSVVLVPAPGASPSDALKWRILCHPDGRVEVHRDDDGDVRALNDRTGKLEDYIEVIDASDPHKPKRLRTRTGDSATITLGQLRATGTIQNAELSVTLDGRVTSRLVATALDGGAAQ